MFLKTEANWKKKLNPEDENMLNELLERTAVNRQAYSLAEEVKAAQLWCALIEMKKENARLKERLGKIEYLIDGFAARVHSLDADKKAVIESHERF